VGKQLEWNMGANPFGQSLMYGSGYDFAPQFAYCVKDIVGSLPVGMDSRAGDAPFWPATVSATFKEIWMEPVNRFMGTVAVYSSQDQVKNSAAKDIQINTQTNQSDDGTISVSAIITGNGKHQLNLKAFNATTDFNHKQVILSQGKPIKIHLKLKVTDKNIPYIAVIAADNDERTRKEIVGSYSSASILAANIK